MLPEAQSMAHPLSRKNEERVKVVEAGSDVMWRVDVFEVEFIVPAGLCGVQEEWDGRLEFLITPLEFFHPRVFQKRRQMTLQRDAVVFVTHQVKASHVVWVLL